MIPSNRVERASPIRADTAAAVVPAIPRTFKAGKRLKPASSIPPPASFKDGSRDVGLHGVHQITADQRAV
jgi:hypothetical protein